MEFAVPLASFFVPLLRRVRISSLVALAAVAPAAAAGEGPDLWDVVGVTAPDVLNIHARSSAASPVIASLPADAPGLRNLGCTGGPSFAEWQAMTPADRTRSARARWCRISYAGSEGWVAGRFLREARGDTKIAAWTVTCPKASCEVEQTGLGAARRTILKILPQGAGNAEITIVRNPAPREGTLTIHMDGQLLSGGPVGPLRRADGRALRMTPDDDITAGLIAAMGRHKTMVLTFPGEAAGVEFHLEGFGEALRVAGEGP